MILGIALIILGTYIEMPNEGRIALIVLGAIKCACSLISMGFKLKAGD